MSLLTINNIYKKFQKKNMVLTGIHGKAIKVCDYERSLENIKKTVFNRMFIKPHQYFIYIYMYCKKTKLYTNVNLNF